MKYVFLHGLGQSAANWEQTIRHIGQGDDVRCPELSEWLVGHEPCYASLYSGLERYCAELEAPFNLCGLSLGGIMALQYGIEHPERVNSMVLIGTQFVMPKGLLKLQNALFRLMPQKAFQGMGFEKRAFIALSRSMMPLDFRAGLGAIGCPVLLVCGERDRANLSASMQMKERIPGARLVILPGSGHEANRDAPDELGKQIGQFFAENL